MLYKIPLVTDLFCFEVYNSLITFLACGGTHISICILSLKKSIWFIKYLLWLIYFVLRTITHYIHISCVFWDTHFLFVLANWKILFGINNKMPSVVLEHNALRNQTAFIRTSIICNWQKADQSHLWIPVILYT